METPKNREEYAAAEAKVEEATKDFNASDEAKHVTPDMQDQIRAKGRWEGSMGAPEFSKVIAAESHRADLIDRDHDEANAINEELNEQKQRELQEKEEKMDFDKMSADELRRFAQVLYRRALSMQAFNFDKVAYPEIEGLQIAANAYFNAKVNKNAAPEVLEPLEKEMREKGSVLKAKFEEYVRQGKNADMGDSGVFPF
jgi:hypothetical protein